jgi:hypothetical protein
MPYPRFEQLDVIWDLPENCPEWDHVLGVLTQLERHLVALGFSDNFLFMATARAKELSQPDSERLVVYQISDETPETPDNHEIPAYANDVFMVFKNYGSFYPTPETIRIVPLGCNKATPSLPIQLMADRAIDLFFVGKEDHREEFFKASDLYCRDAKPSAQIEISRGLRSGEDFTPEVYAHKMAQTKVALCPQGASHETLRIYEAMRAGCVVIAARQLPSWFSEGWPVIELDDWGELKDLADGLLADDKKLQDLSQQTRAWWEEKCSEEAVAQYMARELSLSLMKQSL